jgi:hypothetical protein
MAEDRHAPEDRSRLGPSTSAHTRPAYAAGVQLIGFHCLACGSLIRANEGQPFATPMCAGSKARTGRQHVPARMQPLFLR